MGSPAAAGPPCLSVSTFLRRVLFTSSSSLNNDNYDDTLPPNANRGRHDGDGGTAGPDGSAATVTSAAPKVVDKYAYQEYKTARFECIGFNEAETHAYYRRTGDKRVEPVLINETTFANIPLALSRPFGKKKANPTIVPELHFLPPRVRVLSAWWVRGV